MSSTNSAFKGADWGLLAVASLGWGSSFLFMDVAVDHIRPALVAFLRLAVGVVILATIPVARRPVPRNGGRHRPARAVWMGVPFPLFSIALQWIDSSLAGMLNAAAPLFAAVIATLISRRLPGGLQQVGLVVGFLVWS
jgi:drug/metabolite transporter (DMT)-like permease